jgi:kynureninase
MISEDMEASLSFARSQDQKDPLRNFRQQFYFPLHDGREAIYFCGNSLGLQTKNVEAAFRQELQDWQTLAVSGYSHAKNPWLYYQHQFPPSLSKIVGCLEHELTVMNTLTVNLHLMLLSFYHPTPKRYKIMMEGGAFPSDQYAIETQVRLHRLDPRDAIIEMEPRQGEKLLKHEDILAAIHRHGESLAMVMFGGMNYYTGQLFNMHAITQAAHRVGALAGFDLAHVAGNVPIRLHDWDIDFAVWCSYKYLNGGPGGVGCAYVHERYAHDKEYIRPGGWWGNEESTRFRMEKGFIPKADASGWNLSTAQVFNMVALKASLEIFDKTSMEELRSKSIALTGWLQYLLELLPNISLEIITPSDPGQRGAQLSLYFSEKGREIHQKMLDAGIIVDYREPGVIRVAPAPLYNSFEDVFRFYEMLKKI